MTLREILKTPLFILKGVSTYLPSNVGRYLPSHETQFAGQGARTEERSYDSMNDYARSCYTSFLRTFVALSEQGINGPFRAVGEIGPGDTLGVGLCALLSGSDEFFALDVVPTITLSEYSNEAMLECLIAMFKKREPIPGNEEFPKNLPKLSSYVFPSSILTEELLEHSLSETRLEKIRTLVKLFEAGDVTPKVDELKIVYLVPWNSEDNIRKYKQSLDLIVSFAAMEHVDDVKRVYTDQWQLLKSDGVITHAIDFKCHHTAGLWNGHWTYTDWVWRIIRGRCAYLINRWPHSWHIRALDGIFSIIHDVSYTGESTISHTDLAPRFRNITESDLITRTVFIIAKKLPTALCHGLGQSEV